MAKISISLPSIYEPCLVRTLKNLRDATRDELEVILVSPINPRVEGTEHFVKWIEEPVGTGTGCNAGHAAAFEHMTGEFCMPWVDDHLLADGWDVMALANYKERERAFHATVKGKGKPFVLGLHHAWPHHVGTQFGMFYSYFPLVRRTHLKKVGWFDPAFKKGFADGDLALRVWSAGGRCEWSERALLVVTHEDDRKDGVMFDLSDLDLFVNRWAPRYGKGWDVSHIRGFNLDIEPYFFPDLTEGNTITHNAPDFRDIVLAGGWRPDGAPAYPATL
jgi:hypothetical protein